MTDWRYTLSEAVHHRLRAALAMMEADARAVVTTTRNGVGIQTHELRRLEGSLQELEAARAAAREEVRAAYRAFNHGVSESSWPPWTVAPVTHELGPWTMGLFYPPFADWEVAARARVRPGDRVHRRHDPPDRVCTVTSVDLYYAREDSRGSSPLDTNPGVAHFDDAGCTSVQLLEPALGSK
jgi:hypothetical protein